MTVSGTCIAHIAGKQTDRLKCGLDQNIIKCYFSLPFRPFNLFTIALCLHWLIHAASPQSTLLYCFSNNSRFYQSLQLRCYCLFYILLNTKIHHDVLSSILKFCGCGHCLPAYLIIAPYYNKRFIWLPQLYTASYFAARVPVRMQTGTIIMRAWRFPYHWAAYSLN